jgi:hypothetical protein
MSSEDRHQLIFSTGAAFSGHWPISTPATSLRASLTACRIWGENARKKKKGFIINNYCSAWNQVATQQ